MWLNASDELIGFCEAMIYYALSGLKQAGETLPRAVARGYSYDATFVAWIEQNKAKLMEHILIKIYLETGLCRLRLHDP